LRTRRRNGGRRSKDSTLFSSGGIRHISGLVLAHRAGFPLDRGWVAAALILYALAGLCWIPVVFIQYRMRGLAREALRAGTPLPMAYSHYARVWFWLGVPAFAAMIAIYGLMVVKP
jgi:uncharacterized membrane protein